ncbi:MAG TPA: hypothetical protein VGM90_09845 [Kofleriaceae bacterium]
MIVDHNDPRRRITACCNAEIDGGVSAKVEILPTRMQPPNYGTERVKLGALRVPRPKT